MSKKDLFRRNTAMMALAGLLLLIGLSAGLPAISQETNFQDCENCADSASSGQNDSMTPIADDNVPIEGPENRPQSLDKISTESIGAAPLSANLLSPPDNEILSSGNVRYEWTKAIGSKYYYLEVKNSAGVPVIKQWYNEDEFTSATCSKTPSEILDPGAYTWRIQTWNCESDPSEPTWSSQRHFTVCTSTTVPGRATLTYPKGTIGTRNPTFVWNTVSGATKYYLKVTNAINPTVVIFEDEYDDIEVVDSGICSINPGLDLPEGNYRWWIQAKSCQNNGPWSYYASFRFANVSPGKPVPISPRGLISASNPTFIWTSVQSATKYYLQVENEAGTFVEVEDFAAEEVTQGTRCSAILRLTLPDDDTDYFWRVQASNDAGPGLWSSYKYFEIICPGKKTSSKDIRRTTPKRG
jgi:hypothetical protein